MAFRFKLKDKTVEAGLRRIAIEQIDKAIAAIDEKEPAVAVHELRQRCKRLRSLVQLVRPAFAGYSKENACFRDIARIVSGQRDAKVMQDTYDRLMESFGDQVDRRALGQVRRKFTMERKALGVENNTSEQLAQCRSALHEARARAKKWKLKKTGWKAVSGGLLKTYRQARDATDMAGKENGLDELHDLRKRLKYHWYHCQLLREIERDEMDARAQMAKDLSEILGDHHDLTVFSQRMKSTPDAFGNPHNAETMLALASQKMAELESDALRQSEVLLAEKPKALGKRLGQLWDDWAEHNRLKR